MRGRCPSPRLCPGFQVPRRAQLSEQAALDYPAGSPVRLSILQYGSHRQHHSSATWQPTCPSITALIYDPAGSGQSTGNAPLQTRIARAEEAIAAVQCLRNETRMRPDQVGISGISEGALVTMLAAARDQRTGTKPANRVEMACKRRRDRCGVGCHSMSAGVRSCPFKSTRVPCRMTIRRECGVTACFAGR